MARIVVETDSSKYTIVDRLPQEGEVWLCVESSLLYEMRKRVRGGDPYRHCHQLGKPEDGYGCDPAVSCACWDSAVREGRWVRVLNCPESLSPIRPETTEKE